MATIDDEGQKFFEATSEERLRRIRHYEQVCSAWMPAFNAPEHVPNERSHEYDARLRSAIAAWLPEVERAHPKAGFHGRMWTCSLADELVRLPRMLGGPQVVRI